MTKYITQLHLVLTNTYWTRDAVLFSLVIDIYANTGIKVHLLFLFLEFYMETGQQLGGLRRWQSSKVKAKLKPTVSKKYGDMGKYIITLFTF